MRSPCLILCFALVLFQALSFAAVADEGGDRLALEFLDKTKHLNGQVSQQFRVHLPQKDNGRLRIFYQDANAAEIYTLHPENHLFSIVVDTPTRIHLVVVWQGEQQTMVTATDLALFARSRVAPQRILAGPGASALLQTLPQIRLKDAGSYYWHQTGEPLLFSLPAKGDLTPPMPMVYQNHQRHPLPVETDTPFQFTYVPPHDERLRNTSRIATRQDDIIASVGLGQHSYLLTYALQLHRSRHAHDNRKAGFAVLGGGIFGFTTLIIFYRRRSAPWWSE